MPKNPKNVVWLSLYNDERDYIYCGLNNNSVTAYLKPHKKGLHLQINYHGKGNFAHSTAADLSIFDGLINDEKKSRKHPESYILPGEYTLREVARFVRLKTGDNGWFIAGYFRNEKSKGRKNITRASVMREKEISAVLQSSGIWKRRGKLNWKDCPKEFFKFVSLPTFMQGNTYSYRQWWIQYLTKRASGHNVRLDERLDPTPKINDEELSKRFLASHRKYREKMLATKEENRFAYRRFAEYLLKRELVKADIAQNRYPEIPNAVRGWNKLRIGKYMQFLQSELLTQKRWGMFISNVYEPFYEPFLTKHNDWMVRNVFDSGVEYLNRCPKTKNFIEALHTLVNAGARANDVVKLNLTTANELNTAALWMREISKLRNSKHVLNSHYNHPEIELEDGYVWASFETFHTLSAKYSCCISNAGYYERAMCEGRGHVIYRPDHRTDGGALAFIAFGDRALSYYGDNNEPGEDAQWKIQEIRSYANGNVNERFKLYIQGIVNQMNQSKMGRSPLVPQDEGKQDFKTKVLSDPVGRKVAALYPAFFPELHEQPEQAMANRMIADVEDRMFNALMENVA